MAGTLGIMQPYFLPYLGYWQLIHSVDTFVVYDDVNYIKGGWINRNRVLVCGMASYITVPLHGASPNRHINEIAVHGSPIWREKLLRTVEIAYRRAPHFGDVFPLVETIIRYDAPLLSDFLVAQIRTLADYLDIETEIVVASDRYGDRCLSGQERVIAICREEGAHSYINAQGGQGLYDGRSFRNAGVTLEFLIHRPVPYRQRHPGFVPNLSIVDVLMEVGLEGVRDRLGSFDLVVPAVSG